MKGLDSVTQESPDIVEGFPEISYFKNELLMKKIGSNPDLKAKFEPVKLFKDNTKDEGNY